MAVTQATLAAIQQAGQSIDAARVALAEAVAGHAQRVMAAVAEQPFSVDNDKLFAHWKTTARLAQEVQAIEAQFKTLYETALGLAVPETPVLTALAPATSSRRAAGRSTYGLDTSSAEDVEVKSGPKPATRKVKRARGAAAPARKPASGASPDAIALSANDAKLLDFLKTALNRRSWQRMPQSAMAQGAGLPLGSVGLALRRLLAGGHVIEGEKGRYKRG